MQSYKTYTQLLFANIYPVGHLGCQLVSQPRCEHINTHIYICLKLKIKIINQRGECKKSAVEDAKTTISHWNQVTRHDSFPLWSQGLSFSSQCLNMEIDMAKSQTLLYSAFPSLFKKKYFSYYIMHYRKALEK